MTNRIDKFDAPEGKPGSGVHVVQTPFGVFHVVVNVQPGQPDPLAFAIRIFEEEIAAGATDPLLATLQRLKQIGTSSSNAPLMAGLALLQQMSAAGAIPPVSPMLAQAGFSAQEISDLLGGKPGAIEALRKRAQDGSLN